MWRRRTCPRKSFSSGLSSLSSVHSRTMAGMDPSLRMQLLCWEMSPLLVLIPYYASLVYKVHGFWFLLPLVVTSWEIDHGEPHRDVYVLNSMLLLWWSVVNTCWWFYTRAWTNHLLTACIVVGLSCRVKRLMEPRASLHALDRLVSGCVSTTLLIAHTRAFLSK